MPWYILPALAPNLLAVARGLTSVGSEVKRRSGTFLCAAVFVPMICGSLLRHFDHCRSAHSPASSREAIYMHVSETLEQLTTPTDRIAVTELGVLGFYSSRFVGDTVGLVWPEAIPHYRAPGLLTLSLLEAERPECIASIRCFFEAGLTEMPAFTNDYKLAYEFATTFRGGRDPEREAFAIYKRRGEEK